MRARRCWYPVYRFLSGQIFNFQSLLFAAYLSMLYSPVLGQSPKRVPTLGNFPNIPPYISEAEVPAAAMLTADGRELANQLRNLVRSESVIGKNHPARASIATEISILRSRLAVIGKQNRVANTEKLKSEPDSVDELPASAGYEELEAPSPPTTDLRRLLTELRGTIKKLEARVVSLERRLNEDSLPAPSN